MILTFFKKIILLYRFTGQKIFGYVIIPVVFLPLWLFQKADLSDSASSFSQFIFNDSAIIEFKGTTISFGTVAPGKTIIKEFHFKNTGTDSLWIHTVQASDGGTIAYWPKEAIPPGARNIIKVEFGFTKSRSGYQDKEFTVLTNAQNGPVMLHLKGCITK